MIKFKTAAMGLALVGLVGVGATVTTLSIRAGRAQAQTNALASSSPQPADPPGTALVRQESSDGHGILTIVPDGSVVKKGDIICELDSLEPKDQFVKQMFATVAVERTYQTQVMAREVAEMDRNQYLDGPFKLELAEAEAGIAQAELDLASAEKGRPAAEKQDAGPSLRRARFALEAAQVRKKVLHEYSKPKRIKEMQLALEVAQHAELASKASLELEQTKGKRLERDIQACTIVAPCDGMLVYYYGPVGTKPRMGQKGDGTSAPWPFIEVGAFAHPQQVLFKIVPLTEPMPQAR